MCRKRLDVNELDLHRVINQSSSKGNLVKYTNGKIWYKENKLGYEDVAEVLVSKLLKHSNLSPTDYVTYELAELTDKDRVFSLGCVSKSFLDINEEFISFGRLLNLCGIYLKDILDITNLKDRKNFLIQQIQSLTNLNVENYLANTFALDCVIRNEDRHLFNLGLVYNNSTNKYREAPIFDNGMGLLSDTQTYIEDVSLLKLYRKLKAKPLTSDFEKQLKLFSPTIKFNREGIKEILTNCKNIRIEYVLVQGKKLHPELFI